MIRAKTGRKITAAVGVRSCDAVPGGGLKDMKKKLTRAFKKRGIHHNCLAVSTAPDIEHEEDIIAGRLDDEIFGI